ncbi:MAG: MATE family efflux transporter [Treponema sp.]|jgi:putative MATE family efflux protein|nr:MATE family efflux transporter [Treponema sp.]
MDPSSGGKYSLTEGGILRKLLLIAVPIMGTQFLQMAYNLTDMFWLGRVGSDAVAASGAAGMYMWLSFGFILIGRMGAEIGVAQSLGRGDRQAARSFSQNAMVIALVLGLAFGLTLILFKRELAAFFGFREPQVAEDASVYLSIVGFSVPITFISAVVVGTYNAAGNSRTPFLLNALGLAANVILDPLFILGLGMGVRGAAAATVISQMIAGILMIIAIILFPDRPFDRYSFRLRPDKKKILLILKWAIPIGLESILFCFLSMVTSRIEASFGANVVAASKVGSQIESLSWLIGGGFGSALVVFIGQNYGAGKAERIRRGVRISAAAMALWGILVSLFLFFAGGFVFSLFLPGPELQKLGVPYLRILAFCQLFMNLEAVGAGAFKGTGRTIPPSLASIISNIIKPVLALILSKTSLGLYGIWVAVCATAVLRGVWICLWYALSGSISPRKTG